MHFPKIMKQKKQNLGFFFVLKNGTWRCLKRTHVLTYSRKNFLRDTIR